MASLVTDAYLWHDLNIVAALVGPQLREPYRLQPSDLLLRVPSEDFIPYPDVIDCTLPLSEIYDKVAFE
jgi:hypothetical protein